jgi:hypothetical protein
MRIALAEGSGKARTVNAVVVPEPCCAGPHFIAEGCAVDTARPGE